MLYLDRRWARDDFIQVSEMLNGNFRIPIDELFAPHPAGNRRGHHFYPHDKHIAFQIHVFAGAFGTFLIKNI